MQFPDSNSKFCCCNQPKISTNSLPGGKTLKPALLRAGFVSPLNTYFVERYNHQVKIKQQGRQKVQHVQ